MHYSEDASEESDQDRNAIEGSTARQSEPSFRGHRSVDDRYVAGVLGGLGERFDIDPTFLRLATFGAAIALRNTAPALVPALYALAWITVPEPGRRALLPSIRERSSLQEAAAAVGLAIVAFLVLTSDRLWVAAALAIAAWALLDRSSPDRDQPEGPEQQTAASEAAQPGGTDPNARSSQWGRSRRGVAEPLQSLRTRRPQRARVTRPKRQPALWPLTVALLLALTVGFVALDQTSSAGLNPAIFVNLGLITVGSVLCLSAWRGRAGWTTALALPLLVGWVAFSAADIGRFDGQGDTQETVRAFPENGRLEFELGYGSLNVAVDPDVVQPGRTLNLDLNVTAGAVTLMVPHDVRLETTSHIGVGSVSVEARDGQRWNDAATVINDTRVRSYGVAESTCYTEPLSREAIHEIYGPWSTDILAPDGNLPPAVAADLERNGFAIPEFVGDQDGQEIWQVSRDEWGHACTPEAPPTNPGTIAVATTIGLGDLNIVRSY